MCDQRHNIIKHTGDEDEEDLEFLRLAALKSLQNKKEPIPSPSLQYNNERITNNFKTGQNTYRIEQQYIPKQHQISPNNYSTLNENYFTATNKPRAPYRHPIDGNNTIRTVNQNNLENYGIHGVEKLNINEPYVPHCLPTGNTSHPTIHPPVNTNWITDSTTIGNPNNHRHGYHPTVPYVNSVQPKPIGIHDSISGTGGGGLSNVQLSPRSLAFVEQNNDILARRKGGNFSPNNYNRSPRRSKSPDYRRNTDSINYKQHSPNYSLNNSPAYRPSSPTYASDFYKSTSPRRWSVSPPPSHNYKKAISRSPPSQLSRQRSPGFNRKRTISRSPQRYISRSPPPSLSGAIKKRTRSRSPIITLNPNIKPRSPQILSSSVRRYSRSPQPINERHIRKTSRSPKMGNNSRNCSPYTSRYPVNKNRSPTNHHNKKRSPNCGGDSISETRQNRIRSPPIQISSTNLHVQHQNKNYNKRKSLSPNNQQQIQRNRSRTPPMHSSPLRKYPRRSRDRNVGGLIPEQEKNRNKRSPVNKKRNGGTRNRGNNIRHNTRRSQSPSVGLSNFNNYNNRKRRSRSRNSEKRKRFAGGDGKDNNYDRRRYDRNGTDFKRREINMEKYDREHNRNINNKNTNNENDKTIKNDNQLMKKDNTDNNENLNLEIIETTNTICNDITSLTPPLRNNEEILNEKSNQHKNIKEKSNDTYDNCNNGDNKTNTSEIDDNDDDDDEDGIDLFPSDDSESETEGRFKSNSNRNERKLNVPTLSFAKLNATSSVPDVIKDLQDVCNNNNKNSRSGGGDHRFDRRRDDRFKKNNSRHSRIDKRRYNDNNVRNRKNSRSRSADRKNRDEKNDRREIGSDEKRKNLDKTMFKSTFQAIDNDGNKISSKISSKTERGSSLGKFSNNENNKKRFKDSEDSVEICNFQQHQMKTHSLKRYLKTSTPPIVNLDKCKSAKFDSTEKNTNVVRSLTPTATNDEDRSDVTSTNGKKSIHSRLGAMTNTFKSAKKSSAWTKTGSSLTPPLPSISDKVSIFSIF